MTILLCRLIGTIGTIKLERAQIKIAHTFYHKKNICIKFLFHWTFSEIRIIDCTYCKAPSFVHRQFDINLYCLEQVINLQALLDKPACLRFVFVKLNQKKLQILRRQCCLLPRAAKLIFSDKNSNISNRLTPWLIQFCIFFSLFSFAISRLLNFFF